MTESEWASCDSPGPMLEFARGVATDRQLRLFACACCWSVWRFVPDGPCRAAVDVSLRFADGEATAEELASARAAAMVAADRADTKSAAAWAACEAANPSAFRAARAASEEAREQLRRENPRAADDEARQQAHFLRDIAGGLLLPAWPAHVRGLGWDPAARRAADELYECPDDMVVLADRLEALGWVPRFVLDHCRSPGPHVRGCWLIDLLRARPGPGPAATESERSTASAPAVPPTRPEVARARAALAAHLGERKYRRFLRRWLASGGEPVDDRVVREWDEFLAAHPRAGEGVGLAEAGRACYAHGCGVVERVAAGPRDPPGLPRAGVYAEARGRLFPYALTTEVSGWPERVVWWCPRCQEAWDEWRADNLRGFPSGGAESRASL